MPPGESDRIGEPLRNGENSPLNLNDDVLFRRLSALYEYQASAFVIVRYDFASQTWNQVFEKFRLCNRDFTIGIGEFVKTLLNTRLVQIHGSNTNFAG